jgi:hypothetical protein
MPKYPSAASRTSSAFICTPSEGAAASVAKFSMALENDLGYLNFTPEMKHRRNVGYKLQ